MPRRRTTAAARRTRRRIPDGFSTAFLLPDLHPWLKEFFADRNLTPIMDEGWRTFPKWEPVPTRESGVSNQESMGLILPEIATTAAAPLTTRDTAPAATPSPAIERARNSLFVIHDSSIRPSAAPVPFTIPVDASASVTPSRHLLRLIASPVHHDYPVAPNFIASTVTGGLRTLSPRVREPAPALRIPAPYNELLIVNIVLGPLDVLWRTIGWPLWALLRPLAVGRGLATMLRPVVKRGLTMGLRIPHPSVFLRDCISRVAGLWPRRRQLNALFRMEGAHEQLRERLKEFTGDFGRSIVGTRLAMVTANTKPTLAGALRHAAAFAVVLLVVLLPLKLLSMRARLPEIRGRVLSATADAFGAFESGGTALTRSSFEDAVAAFDRARIALEDLPSTAGTLPRLALTIGRYVPGLQSTLGSVENGRRAGIALADASGAAARGLATLERLDLTDPQAATEINAATASFASARTFAGIARPLLQDATPQLSAPIDRAVGELRRLEHLLPILSALGGIDRPRRILLVFQNPAELRPTGGFIGSFALVDVAAGRVRALELPGGGSYDVSGVSRIRVVPPDPLRLLSDTWQFHDANWFPDFPTSARKIREFFAASGGPSVDAVVAVNAPILEEVLAITGPIRVNEQTFTATDATAALTDTVENVKVRATNKPKAIIGTLAPELLRRLLAITERGTPQERIQLLALLLRALEERDVLLAFTDDATARIATDARWTGALRPIDRDGLLVVHANIGGGKSDAAIRDDLAHVATILDDGSVVDTVTITRTHTGSAPSERVTPTETLRAFRNIDYLRVYVPRDAELLAADGFESPPATAFEPIPTDAIPDRLLLATTLREREDPATGIRIAEEFGRMVFGGWVQTPSGETRTVRLVYRLPWQYERMTKGAFGRSITANPQPYSMAFQKQPGTRLTVRHTLEIAPTWRTTWRAENLRAVGPRTCLRTEASCNDAKVWTFEDILTSDQFTGVMIAPR